MTEDPRAGCEHDRASGWSLNATIRASGIEITHIAGFVFLEDLERDETHQVRFPGNMVENAMWGRSDDEVLVLIDVPPMKDGMKRRLAAFPMSALLTENISRPTREWWLGRGPLVTSGFDRDTATFLLERKEELLAWSLR